MSDGFRLESEVVEAHARSVAEIAQRVREIAAAGKHTQRLSDDAFGLIGRAFAVTARTGMEQGVRGITALADAGDALVRGLDATAACYQQVERANTSLFGGGQR